MLACAGFVGIEWQNEFYLPFRGGPSGSYHGVAHAFKTTDGWGPKTVHAETILGRQRLALGEFEVLPRGTADELRARNSAQSLQIARLQALVEGYERGRFIQLMRWLRTRRK